MIYCVQSHHAGVYYLTAHSISPAFSASTLTIIHSDQLFLTFTYERRHEIISPSLSELFHLTYVPVPYVLLKITEYCEFFKFSYMYIWCIYVYTHHTCTHMCVWGGQGNVSNHP